MAGSGLTAGFFLEPTAPEHAEPVPVYRQFPLIALPVLQEQSLRGLLFLRFGVEWQGGAVDPDAAAATALVQDAVQTSVFPLLLTSGFDPATVGIDGLAQRIAGALGQNEARMQLPALSFLQLEFVQRDDLRGDFGSN